MRRGASPRSCPTRTASAPFSRRPRSHSGCRRSDCRCGRTHRETRSTGNCPRRRRRIRSATAPHRWRACRAARLIAGGERRIVVAAERSAGLVEQRCILRKGRRQRMAQDRSVHGGPVFRRAILRGIGQRLRQQFVPGRARQQGCVAGTQQLRHRPPDLALAENAGRDFGIGAIGHSPHAAPVRNELASARCATRHRPRLPWTPHSCRRSSRRCGRATPRPRHRRQDCESGRGIRAR